MGDGLPEKLLNSLEESRRSFVSKLIRGTAFVVPGVASFSMSGLGLNEALAQAGNQSHHGPLNINIGGQGNGGQSVSGVLNEQNVTGNVATGIHNNASPLFRPPLPHK